MKQNWIFLDLGNVVVDVEVARSRSAFEALTGLGDEDFDWIFFDSGLIDVFNRGHLSEEGFVRRVQGEVRFRGGDIGEEDVRRVWDAMLVPVPGTAEWLRETEPSLTGIWVVSDINPMHWRACKAHLESIPLTRVKGATLSFEVGETKPGEAMFRDALTRSGAEPRDVLFVDDRGINVQGARALDIEGVIFHDAGLARVASVAWLERKR